MALESVVAFMPTMFMKGDSAAPMENSPSGIHTIPGGGSPRGAVAFSTVGSRKGEKIIQHASGAAHLLRYELRQATIGDDHWETLDGFVLDASTEQYPEGIDGVLGVRALGGSWVRFDFERGELGWSK